MKFKIDDRVCVNVNGNWESGTLVYIHNADGKTTYKVRCGYRIEETEHIKRFVPISEEDYAKACHSEMERALVLLQKLLPHLMPDVTVNELYGSIAAFVNGLPIGITLDPVCHEYNTLMEVREALAWQVTEMQLVPGDHLSPDYYDDCQVGDPTSLIFAIELFVKTIFSSKLKGCFDTIADAEQAKEWESERMQDVD